MNSDHSDFVIYVDESGDHGLALIDRTYPLFVLAFCIFRKKTYVNDIVPSMQNFKFKHFGHDMVVLHEREIRKAEGAFQFLFDANIRREFMSDLSGLIEGADFSVIASVIHKDKIKGQVDDSTNLYHIALGMGLEAVSRFLVRNEQDHKISHVICEARGKKEDRELELEFRRVCDGQNASRKKLPLRVIFGHKHCNSSGLQLADLVARPIGRKTLQPHQDNRAYDIVEQKLDTTQGNGLMIYPP